MVFTGLMLSVTTGGASEQPLRARNVAQKVTIAVSDRMGRHQAGVGHDRLENTNIITPQGKPPLAADGKSV